jgi:hypothetical protein
MKKSKLSRRPKGMTMNQAKQTKPLPPDPEMLNPNRALWAAAALAEFRRQTGADLADALSDLLADLMHWCDRFGQDFPKELRRALYHYEEETDASLEMTALRSAKF